MNKIEKSNQDRLSRKDLKNRLDNLIHLRYYKGVKYPCKFPVANYPALIIRDEWELDGRIRELRDILWVRKEKDVENNGK